MCSLQRTNPYFISLFLYTPLYTKLKKDGWDDVRNNKTPWCIKGFDCFLTIHKVKRGKKGANGYRLFKADKISSLLFLVT